MFEVEAGFRQGRLPHEVAEGFGGKVLLVDVVIGAAQRARDGPQRFRILPRLVTIDEQPLVRIAHAQHQDLLHGLRTGRNRLQGDGIAIAVDQQSRGALGQGGDFLQGLVDGGAEVGLAAAHEQLHGKSVEDVADQLGIARFHHDRPRIGVEADDPETEVAADAHEDAFDGFPDPLLTGEFSVYARILELHARRKVGDEDEPRRLLGRGLLAILLRHVQFNHHRQTPGEGRERQGAEPRDHPRPSAGLARRSKRQPAHRPNPPGMEPLRERREQKHGHG